MYSTITYAREWIKKREKFMCEIYSSLLSSSTIVVIKIWAVISNVIIHQSYLMWAGQSNKHKYVSSAHKWMRQVSQVFVRVCEYIQNRKLHLTFYGSSKRKKKKSTKKIYLTSIWNLFHALLNIKTAGKVFCYWTPSKRAYIHTYIHSPSIDE